MSKLLWADPCILQAQLYYTVVVTEKQFQREMRRMGYSKEMIRDTHWLGGGSGAAVQQFKGAADDGRDVLIVCIKPVEDEVQLMGLLVHECVHVWQYIREALGEKNPSPEMEAYAVQAIFLQVLQMYAKLVKKKRK